MFMLKKNKIVTANVSHKFIVNSKYVKIYLCISLVTLFCRCPKQCVRTKVFWLDPIPLLLVFKMSQPDNSQTYLLINAEVAPYATHG